MTTTASRVAMVFLFAAAACSEAPTIVNADPRPNEAGPESDGGSNPETPTDGGTVEMCVVPDVSNEIGFHAYDEACVGGWLETAFLQSVDPTAMTKFGSTLALGTDALLVASQDHRTLPTTWRLDRFLRDGRWTRDRIVDAVDVGSQGPVLKGLAVGVGFALIGVPLEPGGGAAWRLAFESDGTTTARAILPPELAENDDFGASIAMHEDLVAIGAPGVDDGAGAVHLFSLADGTATFLETLRTEDPNAGSRFGASIAIDATRILVGAPNCDRLRDGCTDPGGTAHVFLRERDGWRAQPTFTHEVDTEYGFGVSVAWVGSIAVVGAPFGYRCVDPSVGCGRADDRCPTGLTRCVAPGTTYLFTDDPAGGAWQRTELREDLLLHEQAWGVAVDGRAGSLLVGARSDPSCAREWDGIASDVACGGRGAAHLYTRDAGGFVRQHYIKPLDRAEPNFGAAVAHDDSTIVIGAPNHTACDERGERCGKTPGAVYTYEYFTPD